MSQFSAEEYKGHLERLAMAAQISADVPIEDMANEVSRFEAIAPIMEPTAWIHGGSDNLEDAAKLLRAATPLVAWGRKMRQEIEDRTAADKRHAEKP